MQAKNRFLLPEILTESQKVAFLACAHEVLDTEIGGLEAVRDGLGTDFLAWVEACLATFQQQGKLVITGIGKSGHIGQKMAATLSSTGSPAVFMHPVEALHGDLGLLAANDLLIALSYSGETDELLALLPAAKRSAIPIVAVTGNASSTLSELSDLTVPMSVPREACPFNLAPTTSTTALLALGDALAMVLIAARGFAKEDYARLHPAGAIGRSITTRVADIMRRGEHFPCVRPDATVKDALLCMTRTRCGSVAIVDTHDALLGIFTDGDFRRNITDTPDLLDAPIDQFMTRNPVTIRETALAVELLNLLEHRKIDDILVVDEHGRGVGLVDIQDLPRFKVM